MSLIVEDGTNVAGAESYVSLAEANAYFSSRGNPSDWTSLSDAVKEQYLREAADYLEMFYGHRWKGRRSENDQPLAWPRSGVLDQDQYQIEPDVIPQRLKNAQYEATLRRATEGSLLPDVETPGDIKSEDVQAGPVRNSVEYAGGASQLPQYTKVHYQLLPLLKSSQELIRA